MNIYYVLSEGLWTDGCSDPPEPPEPYRICELVVARSRSQAQYLAYKQDQEPYMFDVRDIPKMRAIKLGEVEHEPGIVSYEEGFEEFWTMVALKDENEFHSDRIVEIDTDVCPECGKEVHFGDWPFCPHEPIDNYAFVVHGGTPKSNSGISERLKDVKARRNKERDK